MESIDKERKNLELFGTTQLRKMGKLLRIKNYSRITRSELIDSILDLRSANSLASIS